MTRHSDQPDRHPPSPDELPPLTDQASLEGAWRALMGELGFSAPQLWLMFVDGDRARQLMKVEELPERPDPTDGANLARMVEPLLDERRSCAFLYARPGGRTRTTDDLAWAHLLAAISDRWPVHLANDAELRVVAPDDLLGRSSGAA
ncbi:hypothetical protein ACFQ0K_14790 [Nocardioides caeni]|uniref:Uncharacterized protein n=1 Tax=Nocardioides caeni TaxID=574700 RepID=A0A4S8NEB4_9ACTN|nr:hypothetical protein [Nocardioides caeni]THV14635.1 hypothetical protein E9934_08200 [Nocardioides caeni]